MESATNGLPSDTNSLDVHSLEATTQPFVGRWNKLVSQTNWEKGRIIQQWRETLVDAGAPATEYADEAWSRRVGSVTGQHVGRLRRVYQRFGQTYEQFSGLYWSHFQACLDWDDAEMWLEGAVQNRWSVSQMRQQRWETMGAIADQTPRDEDIVVSEVDEDLEHGVNEPPQPGQQDRNNTYDSTPRSEGPDFGEGDEAQAGGMSRESVASDAYLPDGQQTIDESVQPFSQVGDLPDDLTDAFESFKLAILNHKMDQWRQVTCDEVLSVLDALKLLATAPSSSE
jgi:hypothetical protein